MLMAMNITQKPASPANYSNGRFGATIDLIVEHTMAGTLRGTAAWFANPASKVSAHYGVGLDGTVYQFVSEENTAWAAGVWTINTRAVQIEYEDRNEPFTVGRTPAQYAAGAALKAEIIRRHAAIYLNRDHIKGHNEISNSHPSCPGNWDLDRSVAETVALFTAPAQDPAPTSGAINAKVQITVDVLNARTGPGSQFPVAAKFYRGEATIIGWTKGQQVTINGKTDDVWLESQNHHFASQAGTSGNWGHLPANLSRFQKANLSVSQAYSGVVRKLKK